MRLVGDLVVAAFFSGEKAEGARDRSSASFADAVERGDIGSATAAGSRSGAHAEPPLVPSTGRSSSPRCSSGERRVRCGRRQSAIRWARTRSPRRTANDYLDWLKRLHEESTGTRDLVAHFFRRAFDLVATRWHVRPDRHQHDRPGRHAVSGLRWICTHGGDDLRGRRRVKWPGAAAVVVSVVHVAKGRTAVRRSLDGREVETITAFLFHAAATTTRPTCRERWQELHRQLRPRHGLHLRRHRHEGRRDAARRDAAADREGPAQRGSRSSPTSVARR